MYQIQVVDHENYKFFAERQQNATEIIRADRGTVRDRNGEVLAYTKDDISFYADLRMLNKTERDSIASRFASTFGKTKDHYYRLMKGKKNVPLEKKASREKAILLKNFFVDGLFKQEDYTRVYPYDNLASHILGYVDQNGNGKSGIEKQFEEELEGRNGTLFIEKDARGRGVSVIEDLSMSAIPGKDVYLTIDKIYQKILEEELSAGIKEFEAKSALGIIMNPGNGEILGMANLPDFNPGKYNKYSNNIRRNRILTDTYEPGSTFKSIIMSALLEENLVKEHETVNTENGNYRFKRVNIRDTHEFERLSVREVLEQSSNIGMAKLIDRMDARKVYKYLRDFGFGNPTSIDLPGETDGYLKKPDAFSGLTKTFMSFGYEISVTPLQLITAYSALVNGGYIYQPSITKKVFDPETGKYENNHPVKIRRVISGGTSEQIKDFMVGVVENGTGSFAKLENITVGGKTGTSQKLVDNKYSSKEYNSSFVGFFPADDPQIICLILFDAPGVGRYGGRVAAPVFKKISERIIELDFSFFKNFDKKNDRDYEFEKLTTDLHSEKKQTSYFASRNIEEKNFSDVKKKPEYQKGIMPDLRNMSKRNAAAVLNDLGIEYKISGSGKVVAQSVPAGKKIKDIITCAIKCESENINSLSIN